jgi:hypothetical protein
VYPGASTGRTTVVTHTTALAGHIPVIGNTYPADREVFVATAGVREEFTITAFDVYGNQRLSGGEQFVIQIGFFEEGQYGLSIFVNQQLVANSVPPGIYDVNLQVRSFSLSQGKPCSESLLRLRASAKDAPLRPFLTGSCLLCTHACVCAG